MIKKERQSNVELLKIIAIVFIVLSHSMPNGIDTNIDSIINLHLVPQNIQIVVLQVLNFLGHVGNDIFIICSCWFLIDSKKVNANKVVSLIGQAFFVSVFSLGLFSLMGYKFPLLYTIKQFFPIVFGNSWFLSCYILLYAIHPLLNIIINNLSKRQLCAVSLLMFILYYGVYFVLKNDGYYYSRLIGFIVLYFFVAYFKLYLQKFLINKRNSTIMIIIGFILSVGGFYYLT